MYVSLKTMVVSAIAVGGLATGVAGASPAHPADVGSAAAASMTEEQQVHADVQGLTATQKQLEAVLASRRVSSGIPIDTLIPPVGPTPGGASLSPTRVSPSTTLAAERPTSTYGPQSGPPQQQGQQQTGTPPTTGRGGIQQPPTVPTTVVTVPITRPPEPTTTTTAPRTTTTTTTTRPGTGGGSDD